MVGGRKKMCLYPRLMKNPKYLPNKKNNYNPPEPKDGRTLYVAVGCGKCIECRTQKARSWQIRLMEELETAKYAYFMTLTFDEESLSSLCDEIKTGESNAVATLAVRRFLERWRKRYKKSLRHWLITELGGENDRIHLHGLFFTDFECDNDLFFSIWKYGYTYTGEYCSKKTINYIIKYVMKVDERHKNYEPVILCSAGLGKNFITEQQKQLHKYRPHNSIEYYKLPDGSKVNLPIYYRNKFYTEEEREKLWTDRLDNNTIFVRGIEIKNIDSAEGQRQYFKVLQEQQRQNTELGYGDDTKAWKFEDYNISFKDVNKRPKKLGTAKAVKESTRPCRHAASLVKNETVESNARTRA